MTPTNRARVRRPRDERADAIVDAALRLFGAHGFRGTSIAAVAREVGMTDAGVLHHFPTKRALLAAVLQRSTEQQAGHFREMLSTGGTEALRLLSDWGEVMDQAPQFMGLEVTISAEALDPSSELHDFFVVRYRVLHRWLVRVMEEGKASGELRADMDAEAEATALVAFLDGIRLQHFFGRLPTVTEAVRTYVDALIERASV